MSRTFVVADAHGRSDLVRGLLEQEGASGPDVTVVQLGDLANCVVGSEQADFEALELVREGLIDVMLVGNHEHPYFGGPSFFGFFPHASIRQSLFQIRDRDGLKAAHAVEGVLITHAGLTPWALKRLAFMSAEALAMTINGIWKADPKDLLFSAIGSSRGGYRNEGGILWADWSEPKPRKLRQLVGHTVGNTIRHRNASTCIDLGAGKDSTRIAGAWIEDGEIEVVIYEDLR
jgi:hypothetical protein